MQKTKMLEKNDIKENDRDSIYLSKCEFGGFVWSIACVILSAVDVGSGMYLGCLYFLNNQYLYGGLTLIFVYLASLTYLCELCRTNIFKNLNTSTRWIILILLLTIPVSGISLRLYDFWKKLNSKNNYTKELIEFKYHKACVQAAPQLMLQIYVMLDNVQELQQFSVSLIVLVQRTSIISTLIAITITFCKIEGQEVEGTCKTFILYLSFILTIGSRILGLAILFNLHPYYVLPILIIQGAGHTIFYWVLESQTNWARLSFVPLASIIFTWLPLAVINKWYLILPYSVCVVVQNLIASILWITEKNETFFYDLIAVLSFYPYIVGLILSTLIFYRTPRISYDEEEAHQILK